MTIEASCDYCTYTAYYIEGLEECAHCGCDICKDCKRLYGGEWFCPDCIDSVDKSPLVESYNHGETCQNWLDKGNFLKND